MISTHLQEVFIQEQRITEHGVTLGELNRQAHAFVAANANEMESIETGHLRFVYGRGVVKTEEADCSFCITAGLNDGRWHDPKSSNRKDLK